MHLHGCRIPENAIAYKDLEAGGLNRAVVEVLSRSFPVKDGRLARSLQLVLSAIAAWAPALALVCVNKRQLFVSLACDCH